MRTLALILACLLGSQFGFAQVPTGNPSDWILYERANAMVAQREFGQALQLYKEAVSSAGIFPEAEIGIGNVYFEEGEFDLARAQYEKAYSLRSGFRIAETQYEALYRLADLFQSKEMYREMEDSLLKIEADDKKFSDPESARVRSQIAKNYVEKGIDHTLFLYQFTVPFAQAAHSRLGWFYYRTGRYDQAIQELLYAVIYGSTEMNGALRNLDIEYQFTTLSDMLDAVPNHKELSGFASTSDFFLNLYYLAASSYAAGYPTHATQIWRMLAASRISGKYAALSARQLKAPWIEKIPATGRGTSY